MSLEPQCLTAPRPNRESSLTDAVYPAMLSAITDPLLCGNGIREGTEQCDPPNGPTGDANRMIIFLCGDEVVYYPRTPQEFGKWFPSEKDCNAYVGRIPW